MVINIGITTLGTSEPPVRIGPGGRKMLAFGVCSPTATNSPVHRCARQGGRRHELTPGWYALWNALPVGICLYPLGWWQVSLHRLASSMKG
jgi:hypothetical protein